MGFKKRMICIQAKMMQEGPHQRMIKGESRWGMYASKFKSCYHLYIMSHGYSSITWSSMKESLLPRTCSKACTTTQWRSTKGYAHIRSIRSLTKKQEEMLTSPESKQWRNAITRSIRWLTYLSHKKQMKKEIKDVEEHHDHRESLSDKILWRYLLKEGNTTLIKKERTLDTYEGLGDIKDANNWFYSTKMSWWRNHPTKSNVEAISRWSHDGLLGQSM